MSTPLLTTKLYIPPVRPKFVSRPRLVEQLNAGLHRKLTLISAPAGFGKSTLLAGWIQADDAPQRAVAWLSLDAGDADPARFFAYLIAALQQVDPSIGQAAQAMLQNPQPPAPEPLVTTLINDVAATPQPFILILDDYHTIDALPIHQLMAFLLEHQPPQMHLVIATREDPPLPLSRLRARGQASEIRQDDLRFTEEEAANFLQRVAQADLLPQDVAALQRRTEGWITGLQLAALSIRDHDDARQLIESFTGSHRHVLDYLIEEVFQRQSASVQDFLLKTSILDRFSAPLCDTVVERDDSREMLLALEQANLFLVPLDESRQWYRYHHLFASLLRHRLQIDLPEQTCQLHRQASRWYADNGFPADGVRHALAAGDWESAASLITIASGDLLQRGEVVTLLGWFHALPEQVVCASPQLCIEYSWPLILSDQVDDAEPYLALAEQAAQEQQDTPLLGNIAMAQAYVARLRGDHQRAMELSERSLALLPRDDPSSRSVVGVNLGIAQWLHGQIAQAEQTLAQAERDGRESDNHYARFASLFFLNRIHMVQGKLHQGAEVCRQIIQQGGRLPIAPIAHYDLGRLLYEWNDLQAAADHCQQGIELNRRGGNVEFLVGGLSALAFVRQAQGQAAAARDALQESQQLLDRHPDIPPGTRLYHLCSRIRVALGQGDLEAAALAAESAPGPEESGSFPDYVTLMLMQARLLLAQGQKAAASEHLARLVGMASQTGWQTTVVQARALQALAAPSPDEALAILGEALALAEPLGYVRIFVDSGEPMAELLRQAAAQGVMREYVNELLSAFETPQPPTPVPDQPLVEPLSERELDVLRLLVDGQTNQEIAQTLCVSINTVKTHLKNVYGKLGVNNRRQAADEAKKLGLVT